MPFLTQGCWSHGLLIGGQKYNEPTNVGFSKAAVAQRLCRLNSLLYLGCGILENWTHKYLLMPLPIPSQIHFLTNFQPVPLLTDSKDFTNYHLLYLPLLTMVTLEHSQDIKARIEHFTANGVTSAEAGSKANGTEMSSATADFSPSGMRCDIKNLYQGEADRRGCFTWVDKYPENLEEAAENAETARYALLIRNNKCFDGRKKLEIDSIVVQSPLLKAILGSVLKDYPGVTTGLDRLTFAAPFQPFVHRWERLVHAKERKETQKPSNIWTCCSPHWRPNSKTRSRRRMTSFPTTSLLSSIFGRYSSRAILSSPLKALRSVHFNSKVQITGTLCAAESML